MPKVLSLMMRLIPYVITLGSLALGVALTIEQNSPRGTFAFMTRQGWSPQALPFLAVMCALVGIVGWRPARRSLFWSCVLCVIISVPLVIYAYYGSLYLTNEVQGSYGTLVMFWTAAILAVLFALFVIVLSAWIEVSKLAERLDR